MDVNNLNRRFPELPQNDEPKEVHLALKSEDKPKPIPPVVFPVIPPPSLEERKRMELMIQLNMWANNDKGIAQGIAAILIQTLKQQFEL